MKLMRLTRGLVAVAVLAALLAGAPAALWAVGRPFLPTRIPTLNDLTTVLVRPDNGTLLIGLLVVAGWGVWATLAASITGEIIDRARTGGARAHHSTPFVLWPTRAVTALLIGWIVTAFATSPVAATAPASTAVASDLLPALQSRPGHRATPPGTTACTSSPPATRCGTSPRPCWATHCAGGKSSTSTAGTPSPTAPASATTHSCTSAGPSPCPTTQNRGRTGSRCVPATP